MPKSPCLLLLAAAATALSTPPASAQTVPANRAGTVSASTWPPVTRMADPGPRHFAASRTGSFAGRKIAYRAELSEMIVHDRTGRPAETMFTTSFIAAPAAAQGAARPVAFFFNGGPGGSSNTLMFGAIGPERLARFDPAAMADPTTPVVANDHAILDAADLVLVDAPETGFGRPLPGTDSTTFRSNDGDANAFAQVILRWLVGHGRTASPVYLVGESYGTIRAVLLARDLRTASPRIDLAGIVLVSEALTYNGPATASVRHVSDPISAITSLPDIASLAWYHGLIDNRHQTLEQAIRAAQAFALQEYAPALLAGNRLPDTDRTRIAARLAQLTGIPAGTWIAGDLRLANVRRQLLAGRGLALGQFDGRQTEPLEGIVEDDDRDYKRMMRGLTRASEDMAREEFGATGLPPFLSTVASPPAFEKTWTFVMPPSPGADVVLREQMAANPKLRLMVTQGVFDTTTPIGETDYLFGQIGAPRDRTSFAYYPGGHMLYSDDAGRLAFLDDLRAFVGGRAVTRPFPTPDAAPRP